ncbi:MAG: FtsX-like permease family protein [Firmicutes bacterium]|nr:FtsX-like permease family protein [Bacillota bacterium]
MENIQKKLILRFFLSNSIRFVVIHLLVFLTVAIVTGIGSLAPRMRDAIELLEYGHRYYSPQGIAHLNGLADGIERISFIFPIMFILVTLFVVFMSLTRLVAVERRDIGTLRSLGCSKIEVSSKYFLFVLFATFIGGIKGVLIGHFAVQPLLFSAIQGQIRLPETNSPVPIFGIIAALINIIFALTVVVLILTAVLRHNPVDLMRPKSPKLGRKTLLEYIPFFWRALGTKYRSTLRNEEQNIVQL